MEEKKAHLPFYILDGVFRGGGGAKVWVWRLFNEAKLLFILNEVH